MCLPHRLEQNRLQINLFIQRVVENTPYRGDCFEQDLNGVRFDQRPEPPEPFDRLRTLIEQLARIAQDRAELNRAHRAQKIVEERLQILSLLRQPGDDGDHLPGLIPEHRQQQRVEIGAVGESEERQHLLAGDGRTIPLREEGDHLIEQRLRISHSAFGGPGDGVDRAVVDPHLLGFADELQPLGDQPGRNRQQVEPLAAGDDRRQHLVHFGGREDEFDMRGRLLDRLEQNVPRLLRKHVDFVDDVDLVASVDRLGEHILGQFAHVAGGVAAGGVHLEHVEVALLGDRPAGFTPAAWLPLLRIKTVHRLGENARERGLADAAGTDEEIGVRGPVAENFVAQCPHHMLLPDHVGETLRTPFAGDDLIFAHERAPSRAASTA